MPFRKVKQTSIRTRNAAEGVPYRTPKESLARARTPKRSIRPIFSRQALATASTFPVWQDLWSETAGFDDYSD